MRPEPLGGSARSDALAWLALTLVDGLSPRRAFALIAHFGSPEAALAAPQAALLATGLEAATVAGFAPAAERARREQAALTSAGATFVVWDDPGYPPLLRAIPDPPLALMMRGTLVAADDPAIAIVGTRRASEYGKRVAADLARGLAQAGVTVVSGLAAGIDAAAHWAALEAGGRTLAVLGTGIDRVYPPWHGKLADAIARRGALLTEFACATPPLPFHFPRRNRLISGLTRGTVVVEAAARSGALITAEFAIEQGREVFAVPGPAGAATQRGPHRLIQEGAKLVTNAEDVLSEIAPELVKRLEERRAAVAAEELTVEERHLLAAIGRDGCHVDDVIRQIAVPAGAALETLLALELRGLVDQLPGKRFRRHAA
jgi:DNA processing protein